MQKEVTEETTREVTVDLNKLKEKQMNLRKKLQNLQPSQSIHQTQENSQSSYPKRAKEAKNHDYTYWKTKPVTQLDEQSFVSQNIEHNLENRKVYASNDEIKLPESMKWIKVDTNNIEVMNNISKFLRTYYSTDDSEKFTFNYTTEFLQWAIGSDNICLAIVSKKNNAICGFISASFKTITVFESSKRFAVVNFLCSHPIYRTKNIAQTLIDEIVRQIVKTGVHQGCFTTERWIPTPTSTLRFYHRPLNYIKLQKYGFTDLEMMKHESKKNPEKIQKQFDITEKMSCIPMTLDHMEQVHKIYISYINKYNIYTNYTVQELTHNLLGNTNIVKSFVYIDKDNNVTDFFSYYKLSSAILNETAFINVGYLFLYSCNMNSSKLIMDAMRAMKLDDVDVLNTTDTMIIPELIYTDNLATGEDSEDESFIKSYQYGFLKGSGKIHLNFFNWKCPAITSDKVCWTTF